MTATHLRTPNQDLSPNAAAQALARRTDIVLLGHDLRAALAEITAGLALMQRPASGAEAEDALKRCQATGLSLRILIDQMVRMASEDAPPSLPPQTLSTEELLAALRLRWTRPAQDTGHVFYAGAAPGLPEYLTVDPAVLDRVLTNLIGNALAHTPPGQIAVTIKPDEPGRMMIAVTDEGPGFPAKVLARLDQAEPEVSLTAQSGLGLLSVRRLAQVAGGVLLCRNGPRGAIAALTLPCHAVDARPRPPATGLPDLAGLRLLVVDDSAVSRDLTCHLAGQSGAMALGVDDTDQALAAIARFEPDLLVLDDEMPLCTGRDFLRQLRADGLTPADLPVLCVTSHLGESAHAALLDAGATRVLSKPVLCPLELAQAMLATIETAGALVPFGAAANLQHLREIAGPGAAEELFRHLQEDLGGARRGLAQGLRADDLELIRGHSHVLIALVGTAGAMALHADARGLNDLAQAEGPRTKDEMRQMQLLGARLDRGLGKLLRLLRSMGETEGPTP